MNKLQLVKYCVFFSILLGNGDFIYSQCNNSSPYGSATAPTGGGSTTITTCQYASEYATINGVAATTNYQSTSSIATDFITVRQGAPGGPVIGFGTTPLSWTSTVAGTYYVHYNTNAACGTQNSCRTTTIIHNPAPVIPPDDPCDAQVITVGCSGTMLLGDNTGMTNTAGVPAPSCGSYAGGDIWYSAVVPASGIIQVETYALTLTDIAMSIYSYTGGCSGTFTEIACDDNAGFGNMPLITLTGQTPGNTLYIRVWDKNNNQTGTFNIDATDLSSDYCVKGTGVDLGSGCAQLTAALNGQNGSIWDADDRLDFTTNWIYDFTVNLGSSNAGADGICFVIQNDPAGLSASGASGGSMGSGGISNSLIVEIDTYLNTEDRNDGLTGVLCSGGSDPDHLDIWLNGDVNPGGSTGCPGIGGTRYIPNAVNLLNGGVDYNIENGLDHTLRVSYNSASQTFTATILNAAATVSYGTVSYSPVNAMSLFGTNQPFFGFTASTGGLNNQQSACLASSLILPVELVSFDTECKDNSSLLNWTTASELNNDYFTIERSSDGINFEPIGTVNGAGNSNNIINYTWLDNNPLNELAYYRIQQTDFNGAFSYSDLMTSNCGSNQTITVYPNPTHGSFTFDYFSDKIEPLTIDIRNMAGQIISTQTIQNLNEGYSKRAVDVSEISNGIYFVTFLTGEKQETVKLTIIN